MEEKRIGKDTHEVIAVEAQLRTGSEQNIRKKSMIRPALRGGVLLVDWLLLPTKNAWKTIFIRIL